MLMKNDQYEIRQKHLILPVKYSELCPCGISDRARKHSQNNDLKSRQTPVEEQNLCRRYFYSNFQHKILASGAAG